MGELESIVRSGAWRVGIVLAVFGFVLALASPAAQARQEPESIRKAAAEFLTTHVNGLPGESGFTIGNVDPNNNLAPCGALEAFLPPGSRTFGRLHVGVRCLDQPGWQLFVPAQVSLVSDYLVAARALAIGEPIGAGDLAIRRGNLADRPAGVLTREELAVGQSPRISIGAGQPLRADLLRREPVVQSGQQVKVVSRGTGFAVASEGQAMNSAADGQLARVRMAAGRTISGIARSGGLVEINY